jgi:hypothetical protein
MPVRSPYRLLSKLAPRIGKRSRTLKTAAGANAQGWKYMKERARLLRDQK